MEVIDLEQCVGLIHFTDRPQHHAVHPPED
jgi:hypothetical protein